ncbi:hypothetical protein [Polynucleobacter sp.]|uniref:hypothetical protein n=1 Tax=Polynucleobacter sp. TaxID=2029855 RepID=UPI003F69EBA1
MTENTTQAAECLSHLTAELGTLLPKDKAGLFLEHNAHKNDYQTLKESLEDGSMDMYDWESEEAKNRAIAENECWTLQWYPNTPNGFYAFAAPTLKELLILASV